MNLKASIRSLVTLVFLAAAAVSVSFAGDVKFSGAQQSGESYTIQFMDTYGRTLGAGSSAIRVRWRDNERCVSGVCSANFLVSQLSIEPGFLRPNQQPQEVSVRIAGSSDRYVFTVRAAARLVPGPARSNYLQYRAEGFTATFKELKNGGAQESTGELEGELLFQIKKNPLPR